MLRCSVLLGDPLTVTLLRQPIIRDKHPRLDTATQVWSFDSLLQSQTNPAVDYRHIDPEHTANTHRTCGKHSLQAFVIVQQKVVHFVQYIPDCPRALLNLAPPFHNTLCIT